MKKLVTAVLLTATLLSTGAFAQATKLLFEEKLKLVASIRYDHNYDFIPTSCGKILDNIMEVRIDSDDPYSIVGEIQVKGENVMKGYYKNEEATKAAFTEDGWLRTGDLGTIDRNNRIFIRGRSKTMLLGPSGQNIFPEEIEARLNNMPFILESLIVERNGKLVALAHPDYETMDVAHVDHEMLPAIMEQNRQNLNKQLASYEKIRKFTLLNTPFTIESGEMTPSLKLKRKVIEERYKDLIEDMYKGIQN